MVHLHMYVIGFELTFANFLLEPLHEQHAPAMFFVLMLTHAAVHEPVDELPELSSP